MKELLDKYLPLLNKYELRTAVALKNGDSNLASVCEQKMYLYATFVHDLSESLGSVPLLEVVKGTMFGVEVVYYKTYVID